MIDVQKKSFFKNICFKLIFFDFHSQFLCQVLFDVEIIQHFVSFFTRFNRYFWHFDFEMNVKSQHDSSSYNSHISAEKQCHNLNDKVFNSKQMNAQTQNAIIETSVKLQHFSTLRSSRNFKSISMTLQFFTNQVEKKTFFKTEEKILFSKKSTFDKNKQTTQILIFTSKFAQSINSISIEISNTIFRSSSSCLTIQNSSRKRKWFKFLNISRFVFFIEFQKMQNLRINAKKIHAQRKRQKKIRTTTNQLKIERKILQTENHFFRKMFRNINAQNKNLFNVFVEYRNNKCQRLKTVKCELIQLWKFEFDKKSEKKNVVQKYDLNFEKIVKKMKKIHIALREIEKYVKCTNDSYDISSHENEKINDEIDSDSTFHDIQMTTNLELSNSVWYHHDT